MDKYIIVITLCDKEEIANKIINTLLEKRSLIQKYIVQIRIFLIG